MKLAATILHKDTSRRIPLHRVMKFVKEIVCMLARKSHPFLKERHRLTKEQCQFRRNVQTRKGINAREEWGMASMDVC